MKKRAEILTIRITEQQIADAREDQVRFPTHKHYIAWRFLTEHGVKVIHHELLSIQMDRNEKMFAVHGDVGVALTRRING